MISANGGCKGIVCYGVLNVISWLKSCSSCLETFFHKEAILIMAIVIIIHTFVSFILVSISFLPEACVGEVC